MTVPTQQSLTRFVQGTQVPIAATWVVDTDHTEVRFIARHLVVAKVRGRVPVLEGEVVIADDPVQSFVRATLDLAGIDTGSAERDEHLRSADFFDVTNHPTASLTWAIFAWGSSGPPMKLVQSLLTSLVIEPEESTTMSTLGSAPLDQRRSRSSAPTLAASRATATPAITRKPVVLVMSSILQASSCRAAESPAAPGR